ncbi:MAG: RDD family protein [Dehalococcoidia bacterium]
MKECPTCGAVTDAQWFCRNCGEFLRAPGTDRMAAGLWRRFSGELIDIVLFWLLLIVGWFIWFGFFSARHGQTPGKQILGLRVIRLDGTAATAGTMWLREVLIKGILWNLTEPLSYVAYIWAFFDKDRQTVHDKMVDTYVIYHRGPVDALTPVPLAPGEQFGPAVQPSAPVEDIDASLRRLAKMRDDGLITNEEYEEKRQALVKRL